MPLVDGQTIYIWDCRRSQILASLAGFKMKIKMKFETEKYICTKNKTLDQFIKKRGTSCLKYVKITVFELFLKTNSKVHFLQNVNISYLLINFSSKETKRRVCCQW